MAWTISDKEDLVGIIQFLKQDEWQHVQALSFFYQRKKFIYPGKKDVIALINRRDDAINGIILISSKGLIYPILTHIIYNDTSNKNELIKVLATIQFRTHAIVGLKNDVEYMDSIIFKRIRAINNYLLLHREVTQIFDIISDNRIVKASLQDLNKLIPLENEYQIEEVLLSPKDLNKKGIYVNYKKKLLEDDIYFIENKNIPITKGGTTYKSINYTLLGGIYTWPNLRNRGYSTTLLKHILNEQLILGYKGALFVKENNEAALHLYKKLGFIEPLQYKIHYYLN